LVTILPGVRFFRARDTRQCLSPAFAAWLVAFLPGKSRIGGNPIFHNDFFSLVRLPSSLAAPTGIATVATYDTL
jgi:hypothetical protein